MAHIAQWTGWGNQPFSDNALGKKKKEEEPREAKLKHKEAMDKFEEQAERKRMEHELVGY